MFRIKNIRDVWDRKITIDMILYVFFHMILFVV